MKVMVTSYCGPHDIKNKLLAADPTVEVIFAHHRDAVSFEEILWNECDALVLSGGEDINPAIYNEQSTFSFHPNDNRDDFEMSLLNTAAEKEIKVLGICRGHQLINAFFGGTLHQDIHQDGFAHSGKHIIELDGFGKELFGDSAISTNSLHHQGVKDVAPNFKAIGKHQGDHLIEAIYSEPFKALGVQWHPEWLDNSQEVFTWLTN